MQKTGIHNQPKIIDMETLEKQGLKFVRLPPKFFLEGGCTCKRTMGIWIAKSQGVGAE